MTSRHLSVTQQPRRAMGLFSIILGAIGWFASFQLLTEYIRVLQEPEYSPNCNLSLLVTCGPNMESWQGSLFGFPNPIIGVAAFMAPIIVGVAMFVGARFPTWFWGIYQLGLLGGIVFIHWLAYQSIFVLGTLCPWCMVVWLAMIPLWWSTLFANAAKGNFGTGMKSFGATGIQWAWIVIIVNIVLIAVVAQFRLNWLFTELGIGTY